MKEPLVTIAIPFYNTEKYFAFAIQSVINQTYRNWELLLIDDGGNDLSWKIAKGFAESDNRIKVIKDGENKGLPIRLNESIIMAKGEYYARMDDDDIMDVHRIEKQVAYLQAHPDVDVVGSSAMLINATNNIVGSFSKEGNTENFIHPSVMGHTSWFQDNPYDGKLKRSQDYDLWLRTQKHSKFYNIPEALLFYRNTGIPTRKKYARNMACLRQIASRRNLYGKDMTWSIKLWLSSWVKQYIYNIFGIIGKTDWLVKHRRITVLPDNLCLSQKALLRSINCV